MRKFPQDNGRTSWLLALMLVLALLLFTTLSPLHAVQNTGELEEPYLAVSMMSDGQNGRVTDSDGLIGNEGKGADRADGAKDDGMLPHPGTEIMPRSAVPEENDTASDGNSLGILPWIVASLIVLSIVLAALALIPRKNKSR